MTLNWLVTKKIKWNKKKAGEHVHKCQRRSGSVMELWGLYFIDTYPLVNTGFYKNKLNVGERKYCVKKNKQKTNCFNEFLIHLFTVAFLIITLKSFYIQRLLTKLCKLNINKLPLTRLELLFLFMDHAFWIKKKNKIKSFFVDGIYQWIEHLEKSIALNSWMYWKIKL